ncbi:glycosyltransferase family 2 protein [Solemya velesiana gill symbiont]|nr:glycosyltransferase [Solemya velesiana gill symbiont]
MIDFVRQRPLVLLAKKMFRVWRRSGLSGVRWRKRLLHHQTIGYAQWLMAERQQLSMERESLATEIDGLQNPPLITIVMPVCDPDRPWLEKAIESVRQQTYSHWQLCIADDASTQPYVRQLIESAAASDERIDVVFRESRGHICAATRSALSLSNGEFITFLDHDDEISPYALARIAVGIDRDHEVDLLYSDEDIIGSDGKRYDPYFKPDWNPELLRSQNYLCHLSIYRANLLRELDAFRPEVQGSQDWDLALRASENARCIRHIPHVLYHWRSISGSTAHADNVKVYALDAGRRAVQEHLVRRGEKAEATLLEFGHLRIRRSLPGEMPGVSIVIASDSESDIFRHMKVLQKFNGYSLELVVATTEHFDEMDFPDGCIVFPVDSEEAQSSRLNRAAAAASGDILCFMDERCEAIDAVQLESLVFEAIRTEVGAVGARLLSPGGCIQHAGYFLDFEMIVLHPYRGAPANFAGLRNRALLQQNVSAVSASCLAVKKDLFEQIGGFNAASGVFHDVDFCLRLLEAGLYNIWTPYVSLTMRDSLNDDTVESCQDEADAMQYMKTRWRDQLVRDPAGNPNIMIDHGLPVPVVKRT